MPGVKSLKGLATKASKERALPSMYAIRGGMAEDGGERIVGKAQLMEGDADQSAEGGCPPKALRGIHARHRLDRIQVGADVFLPQRCILCCSLNGRCASPDAPVSRAQVPAS